MKKLISLICFGLFAVVATAQVDDLNTASALVKQQAPQDWSQLQAALTAVVSKKTGLSEAILSAQNTVDTDFKSVILRHYYEQLPFDADFKGLWFHLVVDDERLNQLLIAKDIPLWPSNRPSVFVWLVEEQPDGTLSHAESDSLSHYWLAKWLDNKGISNQFYDPLEADLLQFGPNDVSYLKPELISRVFNDYQPDYVLLVKVRDQGNGFSYRFGLSGNPDVEPIIENRQFVALSSGLKYLAAAIQEKLSSGQQIAAGEFGDFSLVVTINDINSAAGMLRLWNYLQAHPLISQIQASEYRQHSLRLQIQARVSIEALLRVFDKDKVLEYQPLGFNNQTVFKLLP